MKIKVRTEASTYHIYLVYFQSVASVRYIANPPDLFYSKWNARFCLFIPFHLRSIPLICSSSYVCRFGMDDLGLPYRLFETGYEPTRKKWVNNYFKLHWIKVLNSSLEDEDLAMLDASQFGEVLQMGNHTFSTTHIFIILSTFLNVYSICLRMNVIT
ncbi:hypothetical protein Bca52824_064187 [Brassica carinata]|uniref:Uncharacterized protein n=1 Tax=Brassica carinata TaxID=52824 RepID=A0A8X7QG91_BRACI|nr:hypothetical protein Bca52824_064187 [Brassica carinata]